MSPTIELRALTIGYRSRRRTATIAGDLCAAARPGELTALLGPNGCGKSTLLRTVCGLQPPLSGQVLFDAEDLARVAPDELARRVAVVLTDRVDPGLLSAHELVGLGRIPHQGLGARLTSDDHAVIDWALGAVDAHHLARRPAAELSDGERQRVLTARALAQQPSVLVLDEPTAFLDVPSRAGLVEVLRTLAREHDLTIVMSTHDLELALRVADRVWLLGRDGALVDATPEELMLSGQINELFDGDTLCFDPVSGVFEVRGHSGRSARVDASEPVRAALQRVLSREGFRTREPAEIVVTATEDARITVRTGGTPATAATLSSLPTLLRELPVTNRSCAPDAGKVLAENSELSVYFAIGTGPVDETGWFSASRLYSDTDLLDAIIVRVQERMDAPERRVAVSSFFLGVAARLWSVGIGALAGHGMLVDIAADHLLIHEKDGQIRLHIERPVAWQGDDLEPLLADMVLEEHLAPLTEAAHRLGPISSKLLRGNAASALLGSARVFDRGSGSGAGSQLARRLCADERLDGAVHFNDFDDSGYRRTSCCLYYRTGRGVCGDCVFTTAPGTKSRKEAS